MSRIKYQFHSEKMGNKKGAFFKWDNFDGRQPHKKLCKGKA